MHIRWCISVLLGAAAMLLAIVCLPTAANAQGGNISISSVSFTDGDPDVLTVVADDANELPVETMTVDFCQASVSACSDSATPPPVLELPMQPESQSDTRQQTFDLTIPEGQSQGQLPPGTYSMAFDATDADETDTGLTAPNQADLSFVYTAVAVTATATPISYDDVLISGVVTGVPPGSLQPTGLSGVPVYLGDPTPGSTPIAKTEQGGSYSATVKLPSANRSYNVQVLGNQTWGAASVSIEPDATRVSAAVSPADFSYDGKLKATLTGTAYYRSDGSLHPLKDYPVQVTTGASHTTLTTNNKGQFSLTYPPADGAAWSVSVSGGLLHPARATGTIHVAVPLSIKSFSAVLRKSGVITASGCVAVTVPHFTAPDGLADIQYSLGRHGPWKPLGSAKLTISGGKSCRGDNRSYFSKRLRAIDSNAYYRAYLPATVNHRSAGSRSLYRWKYITRIWVKVSPRTVARNGKITISGTLKLWAHGGWRSYGKQQIWIVVRAPGKSEFIPLKKNIKVSAKGRFNTSVDAPNGGGWPNLEVVTAYYPGNSTHFVAFGKEICLRLKGAANRCPKDEE